LRKKSIDISVVLNQIIKCIICSVIGHFGNVKLQRGLAGANLLLVA
jgi:hypothetical protein